MWWCCCCCEGAKTRYIPVPVANAQVEWQTMLASCLGRAVGVFTNSSFSILSTDFAFVSVIPGLLFHTLAVRLVDRISSSLRQTSQRQSPPLTARSSSRSCHCSMRSVCARVCTGTGMCACLCVCLCMPALPVYYASHIGPRPGTLLFLFTFTGTHVSCWHCLGQNVYIRF